MHKNFREIYENSIFQIIKTIKRILNVWKCWFHNQKESTLTRLQNGMKTRSEKGFIWLAMLNIQTHSLIHSLFRKLKSMICYWHFKFKWHKERQYCTFTQNLSFCKMKFLRIVFVLAIKFFSRLQSWHFIVI